MMGDAMATRRRSGTTAPVTARPSPAGEWENQLGSRLHLEVGPEGELRGTFHAGAGSTAPVRPLSGWSDGSTPDGRVALGFAVSWPSTGAVSVWAGQHRADGDVIEATWLLVGGTLPAEAWRATTLGHDTFQRVGGDA